MHLTWSVFLITSYLGLEESVKMGLVSGVIYLDFIYSTKALLTPDKAVMASLALHTKSSESYTPSSFVDFKIPNGNVIQGEWGEYLTPNRDPLQCKNSGRQSLSGKQIRQKFCNYFNVPDQVPWQWGVLVK